MFSITQLLIGCSCIQLTYNHSWRATTLCWNIQFLTLFWPPGFVITHLCIFHPVHLVNWSLPVFWLWTPTRSCDITKFFFFFFFLLVAAAFIGRKISEVLLNECLLIGLSKSMCLVGGIVLNVHSMTEYINPVSQQTIKKIKEKKISIYPNAKVTHFQNGFCLHMNYIKYILFNPDVSHCFITHYNTGKHTDTHTHNGRHVCKNDFSTLDMQISCFMLSAYPTFTYINISREQGVKIRSYLQVFWKINLYEDLGFITSNMYE